MAMVLVALHHTILLNEEYKALAQYIQYYGDISYHTQKMDSSNLNIYAELSMLGENNFSFLPRHVTDRLQTENG